MEIATRKHVVVELANVDVEDFLRELGIKNIDVDKNEVHYSCPFPFHKRGDVVPSASMQIGTTVAHCFSCGWSGNAISFLADYEGISPLKAVQFIRERFGDGFREPENSLLDEVDAILTGAAVASSTTEAAESRLLSEDEITKRFIDWNLVAQGHTSSHHYLLDRGFKPETLLRWEVGYDSISGRYTIPYRDVWGNLIGFKGRISEGVPRYKFLGGAEYGFDTFPAHHHVFGLHRIKEEEESLFVCEGELNTIAMWQMGYTNSVGISGKSISDAQALLLRSRARSVWLIFDETKDAKKCASRFEPWIPTYIAPDHEKDPAEVMGSSPSENLYGLGEFTSSILL